MPHHWDRRKFMFNQVILRVKLPALHALKKRHVNAPGICGPLRRWAPFSRLWLRRALWRWCHSRSNKIWTFEDEAAVDLGVDEPFEDDAASTFELLSKADSPWWSWPKLTSQVICTRLPSWWWWLCNTFRSWDQASDFRSWLRKRPWWKSQRILCILSLIKLLVAALRLPSCRRVQGTLLPTRVSNRDVPLHSLIRRPTGYAGSRPVSSSVPTHHLWSRDEVVCENDHSWPRGFKGTPSPNEKIPPKVNNQSKTDTADNNLNRLETAKTQGG